MVRSLALWGVAVAFSLLMLIAREERLAAQGKVPTGRLRRLWFGPERRRTPRYRVNWSVRYHRSEETSLSAQTRDVSRTGAGLTLLEKVPTGSVLDLELPVPGRKEPLKVAAIVVWTKEIPADPGAQDPQRRFFVGVHFRNLSSTLQQEMGALLKIPGYPVDPERTEQGGTRPGMDPALYASWKRKLWLADLGLTLALFGVLVFGGVAVSWGRWVSARIGTWPLQVAVFAGALWAGSALASFPLDWVRGFRLEHRFGLSTQGFGDWLKDHLKGLLLGGAMGLGIAEGLSGLLRAAPGRWWLWAAALWMLWSALLTWVFPMLLIPLFYKQAPLEKGPVRERLEALLDKCGTRVRDIFSLNLSRTTRKANACLCGLGGSRRVLLSDTLLSRYPAEEIEVVLAHELGHHCRRHIGIGIALSAAAAGLSCFAVDRWARAAMPGLGIAGVADLAALVLIGFGLFIAGFLLMPVTQWVSRRLESQADQFALEKTRDPAAFIAAMRRLAEQNLAEETPPRWAELLLYDHPPISKRIRMAEQFGGKNG